MHCNITATASNAANGVQDVQKGSIGNVQDVQKASDGSMQSDRKQNMWRRHADSDIFEFQIFQQENLMTITVERVNL